MATSTGPRTRPFLELNRWVLAGIVLALAGAAGAFFLLRDRAASPAAPAEPDPKPASAEPERAETIRFERSKWSGVKLEIKPAVVGVFEEREWRSGRLMLNDARTAHIAPLVEGVVREVKANLGDEVKKGDVLAVLDSREVGQAKLDLVKTRLALDNAAAQHEWSKTVNRNAADLVKLVESGLAVAEIEKRIKDRTLGEQRQQLMTAYSKRLQAKTQHDAVSSAEMKDAVPLPTLLRIRSEYEAAEATLVGLCEEIRFQSGQQVRLSEQKVREAETAHAMSRATLLMLGFDEAEVGKMDPLKEGAGVSLYPVRAPFDGTVIDRHAVLAERVDHQHQLFRIADLSALRLKADVSPRDLPLVRELKGTQLYFRLDDAEGSLHPATVLYTGDVVDPETRTVSLIAEAGNPQRRLKPGSFVEVEIVRKGVPVVQVPAGAVQRLDTQPFVFVHLGGEEFRRADIKLGRISGGRAEVLDGLRQDDPVVVSGGFFLKSVMLADRLAGD